MKQNFCILLSSLMISFNLYNLNFVKLMYKNIIIINIVLFITIKIITVFNKMLLAPSILLVLIIYLYNRIRDFSISIIWSSLAILIFLVIDGVIGYLMTGIFFVIQNTSFQFKEYGIYFHVVLFLMNFICTKIIGIHFNRILKKNYKSKIIIFMSVNIITILIVVYTLCMIAKSLKSHILFLSISIFLIGILCTTLISILHIYEEYMKKDLHAMYASRELNQLKQYVSAVENMYNEMRKMKHDYVNVLCSINGYVEEGNSKELKRYFNENILNLNDSLSISSGNLMKLKHIKVEGVKGLIFSKMLQSKSKSVELFLDISEDIEKFYIESIDLCRILGIFWDNAIEEAELCSNGKIKFGVIILENSMVIVLINSCRNNIPYIYKMFEHGFSTKGENRGIGLSNVKELIDKKYDNVTLNTYIDNGEFKQEIIIDYK